jgi:hypothetical protein
MFAQKYIVVTMGSKVNDILLKVNINIFLIAPIFEFLAAEEVRFACKIPELIK